MQPSIGRIVHYRAHGSPNGEHKPEARAAIITQVFSDKCVSLFVATPNGTFHNTSVMLDESGERPGCWFWPPRVSESPKEPAA